MGNGLEIQLSHTRAELERSKRVIYTACGVCLSAAEETKGSPIIQIELRHGIALSYKKLWNHQVPGLGC